MFALFEISLNNVKLRCQREMNVWIAAEFDWKLQSVGSFDQVVDVDKIDKARKNPHLISQFDIEVTLAKRCIPILRSWMKPGYKLNEWLLIDDAFLPKKYTVRLEKGNFLTAYDAMLPKEDQYTPRFALRLVFDQSPYPPRHEWKEPKGAPDAVRMWEWKEFCGRNTPGLKTHRNRNLWSGNCVVS